MTTIKVLSSTQKIIVEQGGSVSIINAGPPGVPGAPGASGQFYHHVQNDLSAAWPVPHNLGFKPALAECLDDAGSRFRPWLEHVDVNNLIAHFVGPLRGTLDLV